MIKTIYDLLYSIKEKGIKDIEPYLGIGHNPTIGDMYEGLTKVIMHRTIFDGLNLKVASGKIKNSKGELSLQIDCMVVIGDGEEIPYTNDFIYDVNDVLAVIEVKKNLFTKDLDGAYLNLKSVYKLAEPNRDIDIEMLEGAFQTITKTKLPTYENIEQLSPKYQMIYHALVVEYFMPARIIFGYDGFANEQSLRNHFIDYINSKKVDERGARGYGVTSLPSLIICGDNALIKTNALPYALDSNNDEWVVYASYNQKPLLLLLEIIWTRLTFMFNISSNIFGEDLELEMIMPLLTAEPTKNGWIYKVINHKREEYTLNNSSTEWKPAFLNEVEFIIMNKLCGGKKISIEDKELITFINSSGQKIEDIITHLNYERLVSLEGRELKLLTRQCSCIITPQFGYVAGENYDGRLQKWIHKQMRR